MSRTRHARKPRHHYFWRIRQSPRPPVPKRLDIAERIAAMLDDLLGAPAVFAVPECDYDPVLTLTDYDEPQDWERELAVMHHPEPDRPHPLNFTDAHCRDCEGCAYEHARQWAPEPDDDHEVAYGPEGPFLPVLTYGQVVAEMGDGFMVTGPNVIRPQRTSQHYLRVYELARICELPSHAVVALLRLQDEYVLNHLSMIARPAAREFLAALDIHGDLDSLIATTRPLSMHERFARAIA